MDEVTKATALEVFKLCDTDNNGFIELREFRRLVRQTSEHKGITFDDDAIIAAFELGDEDNDRKISPEEFMKIFQKMNDEPL